MRFRSPHNFFASAVIIALLYAVAGQSLCAQEPAKQPDEAAKPECTLKAAQAPVVEGYRLGMSLNSVLDSFADIPGLSAISSDKQVSINDESGRQKVVANSSDGFKSIEVFGDYLHHRAAVKGSLDGLTGMTLVFSDDRLTTIELTDWSSPKWSNVAEFTSRMSERYGFADSWWSKPQLSQLVPDPQTTSQDFRSISAGFKCSGFYVVASCIGPPAPPGTCSLTIRDAEFERLMKERRQEEQKKSPPERPTMQNRREERDGERWDGRVRS
jgi:hypothetical protein